MSMEKLEALYLKHEKAYYKQSKFNNCPTSRAAYHYYRMMELLNKMEVLKSGDE